MTTSAHPEHVLDDPDRLLEPDDRALVTLVAERAAAAGDAARQRVALADRLRAFVGLGGAVLAAASREAALERAAAGRNLVVVPIDAGPLTAAALDATESPPGPSALAVEPRFLDADEATRGAARLRARRGEGVRIVADETRTAGRIARRAAFASAGIDVDAVVVGPSLAAGRPFWAAILDTPGDDDLNAVDDDTAATALAVLDRLVDEPIDEQLRAVGETVRAAFTDACRREDVHAAMVGPAALPSLRFDGQENAEAPLIALHFGLELQALGVRAGTDLAFGSAHPAAAHEIASASTRRSPASARC